MELIEGGRVDCNSVVVGMQDAVITFFANADFELIQRAEEWGLVETAYDFEAGATHKFAYYRITPKLYQEILLSVDEELDPLRQWFNYQALIDVAQGVTSEEIANSEEMIVVIALTLEESSMPSEDIVRTVRALKIVGAGEEIS